MESRHFEQFEDGFFIAKEYSDLFRKIGLVSFEAIFNYEGGDSLVKSNLKKHRRRTRFKLPGMNKTFYLKRYNRVPVKTQLKNWMDHLSRKFTSDLDRLACEELAAVAIATPVTIAYGGQWGKFFEKRSFMVMEEVQNGVSLEQKLPDCFADEGSHKERCEFINRLADFTKRFHDTGYRHRDYYLCHIFLVNSKYFCLIDMHRSFKPILFSERYRVKDITQLHYSAPGKIISSTDRLRFYLRYAGKKKIDIADRKFLRKVRTKAWRIADHDIKNERRVPFAE